MIIVKHVDYATDHSDILEAIQEIPETDETINGWALNAWTALCYRGVKVRLKSSKSVRTIGFGERTTSLSMLPVGQLVMVGLEKGGIMMYDFAAGRQWGWYLGHEGSVSSIAISQDSKVALSGGTDQSIRLWELDYRFIMPMLADIAKTAGDDLMIINSNADDLLPNARTSKLILQGHKGKVNSVAISSDGQLGLSGSDDHTVRLWDLSNGKCLQIWKGHSRTVGSVTFSPDGRLAISSSEDQTIRIWDLISGRTVSILKGHNAGVRTLNVLETEGGGILISGDAEGKIFIWDIQKASRISTLMEKINRLDSYHAGGIRSLVVIPGDVRVGKLNAHRFSGGQDCMLMGADVMTGNIEIKEPHDRYVNGVCLSPDGHFLLSVCDDGFLRLWRLDWEYEFPTMVNWDERAKPFLENFLKKQTIDYTKIKGKQILQRAKTISTKNNFPWTEENFNDLLNQIRLHGYGWIKPQGIRYELERMAR